MGARGPAKMPKNKLAMRGSRLTAARTEIPHAVGECKCPVWLQDIGRGKWNEMIPLLAAVPGMMKPAFVDALSLYCEAFEEFMDARRQLEVSGTTVFSEKGGCYQHPDVGRKNKAIQRMRQFGALFGLSPSDATRVGGGEQGAADSDPFAAFLDRGEN